MKNLVLLTTVTAGLNLALMSSANGATYGGDATGAVVTVTATGTTIRAATNSLSISGGEADAALSAGDIPGSALAARDRKRTRLNSSHPVISYAVLCLK